MSESKHYILDNIIVTDKGIKFSKFFFSILFGNREIGRKLLYSDLESFLKTGTTLQFSVQKENTS